MPMELISIERTDNITHLKLRGALDMAGIRAVDTRFYGETSARDRPAIVDLSELDSITSLGIGMLFGCAKSLHRRGYRMVLLQPRGLVDDVLRRVGVHEVIPFAASLDEALKIAREGPRPA
jgi:anti-anti-sigma factor